MTKQEAYNALVAAHRSIEPSWFNDQRGPYSRVINAVEAALSAWDEAEAEIETD